MATFAEVLREIQDVELHRQREGVSDPVRRKYLRRLHELTERNVVAYYSAFLQRQGPEHFFNTQINDEDKHGFMASFAGLDFSKGLDLILHTPGGDVAATESIIDYLRSKFATDIRTIVPQISMSGGTMIALAGCEVVMGRHSNLGPIDPQIGGKPAFAILEEFERARQEIQADPKNALLWQPILQQYAPTLLSNAQQSIQWAQEIGRKTLCEGMFKDEEDADAKAQTLVEFLISRDLHRAHGRHLHRAELRAQGLKVIDLESDPALQDAVLSVHHACMLSVGNYNAVKLIENHAGIAHIKALQQVQIPLRVPVQPGQPQRMPAAPAPQQPIPNQAPAPAQDRLGLLDRTKAALRILFGRV